jgi:hypothetical protein
MSELWECAPVSEPAAVRHCAHAQVAGHGRVQAVHGHLEANGPAVRPGPDTGHDGLRQARRRCSQVRAAAARRVAEQKVRAAAVKLDVDPQEVSTDPVALLGDMIRSGAIMMERFSRLVDRCEDGYSPGLHGQVRPEFAALRAERESLGRHLELWLKVSLAQAQLNRSEAASQLTDRVATALSVAVTSVLLRHPQLDALGLHEEIKEEFGRVARA